MLIIQNHLYLLLIGDDDKSLYLASRDDNANTTASVWINNDTSSANTRSGIAVDNSDNQRHVFLYSRDDNANTISVGDIDDDDKRIIMSTMRTDGSKYWPTMGYPQDPFIRSYADFVANNAPGGGSASIEAADKDTKVKSSVVASYVDKNILISAEDTSANTISSLEVSNAKQNIYMVAKDETDGTRATLNINNRDDNKRVFITARNDDKATRSVIEVNNKEEHVYLEASGDDTKTYIIASRKDKNISLSVEAETGITVLQVTEAGVTINGKKVLTQDDIDALRPPSRRSIFGWFMGR